MINATKWWCNSVSHEGRDNENPRGRDEADGEHCETDILRLLEVTS